MYNIIKMMNTMILNMTMMNIMSNMVMNWMMERIKNMMTITVILLMFIKNEEAVVVMNMMSVMVI